MAYLSYSPEVEQTARMLASAAGVTWEKLPRYPGYSRNLWREEAAAILGPLGVKLTILSDFNCDGAWTAEK